MASVLVFFVNGRRVEEKGVVDPEMTLLKYLRTTLRLTGTKLGCGEGGCGACTVLLYPELTPINACLFPLPAAHNRHIITIEGINNLDGDVGGKVQEQMNKAHGSQCGFCTPGFVMSMVSGVVRGGVDVEDALAGNLCRCTGYRPIIQSYLDLLSGKSDDCSVQKEHDETVIKETCEFRGPRVTWITPSTLGELLELKSEHGDKAVLVSGNTEVGIDLKFKNVVPPIILYPYWIKELNDLRTEEDCLVVGSNVTLQRLAESVATMRDQNGVYGVLEEGLKWFAGRQIRSVATLAGNVATASPISDMNPVLACLNASITLLSSKNGERVVAMREFITGYRRTLMTSDEVIKDIRVPLLRSDEFAWTWKQSKRREDDIAIVNCAIWSKRDLSAVCICLGGVDSYMRTFHFKDKIAKDAMCNEILGNLRLTSDVPGGMPEYRMALIKGKTA